MKFTFDRDAMIGEVAIAQEIISTKNAGSILSNVFLSASGNALTIKATDIKVAFQTTVPVQVQEEGSTTVYCDKFMGILASITGIITSRISSPSSGSAAICTAWTPSLPTTTS